MSVINIDENILTHIGFIQAMASLASKPANPITILFGEWARVQVIGLQYCTIADGTIPFHVWDREKLPAEFIDFEICIKEENGIRIVGHEQIFKWKLSASKGGKKSAEKRSKNGKKDLAPLENPSSDSKGSQGSASLSKGSQVVASESKGVQGCSSVSNHEQVWARVLKGEQHLSLSCSLSLSFLNSYEKLLNFSFFPFLKHLQTLEQGANSEFQPRKDFHGNDFSNCTENTNQNSQSFGNFENSQSLCQGSSEGESENFETCEVESKISRSGQQEKSSSSEGKIEFSESKNENKKINFYGTGFNPNLSISGLGTVETLKQILPSASLKKWVAKFGNETVEREFKRIVKHYYFSGAKRPPNPPKTPSQWVERIEPWLEKSRQNLSSRKHSTKNNLSYLRVAL